MQLSGIVKEKVRQSFILVDMVTWFEGIKYINSRISENTNLLRLRRPYIFNLYIATLVTDICIYHNLSPDYATNSSRNGTVL